MKNLARWCYRHRWIVVISWIIALFAASGINGAVGANYSEDFNLPNTESTRALNALIENAPARAGETDLVVLHAKQGSLADAGNQQGISKIVNDLRAVPHVTSVDDYAAAEAQQQVSQDQKIAFLNVQLDGPGPEIGIDNVKSIIDKAKAAESDTLQVELSGDSIAYAAHGEESGHLNEIIGLIAAAVVLFLAFGSIFTMFLPIACGLLAVGIGAAIIGLLTHVFDIAEFAPILAALIGLGVGIDYALFIVSRHRSNLHMGMAPEESVALSINAAGRAVVFAGTTVCIGILGLILTGVTFFYGLALGVVVTVVLTMLASITLLPALLGFVKMRALSKRQRKELEESGPVDSAHDISQGWSNWARLVQRHKALMAAGALALMLVIAAPVLGIRLGSPDAGGHPEGSTTREAYDLLASGFGPGFNGPLLLVAETPGTAQLDAFSNVLEQIKGRENVAAVTPATQIPDSKIATAQVFPASKPQDEATTDLISDLRKNVTHPASDEVEVNIGGSTAIFQDFTDVLSDKLPIFMGAVIGLSFILLMAVFRSLLIPLVASFMNVLSAAASFGVVVAIFQWGWGADLLGIEQTGPILSFLPVMAFAILFGLSMDYEVFLVSRMYEEWHNTNDNDEAVALGQAETGRVITAAASIMIVIFVSFVFGNDATIKLFGIALASAVLLDALVVRTILVPAIMNALGKSNWYLPKWLDRTLPRINVESAND